MARKVASFRLDVDLLDWVGVYAKTRGASQAVVIESALANLKREAEGGVPDLPVADTPEVRVERALKAAPVQRAIVDTSAPRVEPDLGAPGAH
jgi:hypothetical protein